MLYNSFPEGLLLIWTNSFVWIGTNAISRKLPISKHSIKSFSVKVLRAVFPLISSRQSIPFKLLIFTLLHQSELDTKQAFGI